MAEIIGWVVGNVGNICTVVCGVILVASVIVKLTPSTKDNEVLGRIISILDKASIAKTADDRKCIEDAKRNLK
ncbi:MAG: hypothetical protein KBS81_01530 [Spirochaetales bacterium]|nr:hypothetical protein [Candidatus Physcosoma equi]